MKKIFALFFIILPLILTSCGLNNFKQFDAYNNDKDSYEFVQKNGYYKPDKLSIDYQEVLQDFPWTSSQKKVTLPSLGEQKLLVIPIEFNDRACSMLPNGCEKTRIQIQNSFFGADSRNEYYSVASFYNSSSFGKLHISGKVANWYKTTYNVRDLLPETDKMLNKSIDGNKGKIVDEIVNDAIKDYKQKNNDISEFDTNNDGYIDAVAFIYAADYDRNDSFLWAYQHSTTNPQNKEDPELRTYMWASYAFMRAGDFSIKPDAHTFIHETGHLLGLDDYYPKDANQKFVPMGGMDMMDLNIGDHSIFSKMLLNWTRPYVVEDSCTIKINASYKNGDCILIPTSNWNGSAMDEYVLIELYSPKGLNRKDSNKIYDDGNKMFSLMTAPGIKMYHVDARVAYYMTYGASPFIGYYGDANLESTLDYYDSIGQLYYRKVDHSNTLSDSHNQIPLIEVVDRRGQSSLREGNLYNNGSLLAKGDAITSFTFHSGEKMKYTIEIQDLNSYSATLKFTKK